MSVPRLLLCLVLIGVIGFAQTVKVQIPASENPQSADSPPSKKGGENQTQPGAFNGGTKEAPLFVTVTNVAKGEKTAENGGPDDAKSKPSDWWMIWLTLATVLILGFEVYQTWEGHRASKKELRAYASFVINFDPSKDPAPNEEYHLIFSCINHGQTPALKVGFRGGIWQRPLPLIPQNFPDLAPGVDAERMNLFPSENQVERSMGFNSNTTTKFTAEEIAQVKAGTHAFVIGLRIQYQDFFKQIHETREYWCIRYAKNGARTVYMIPGVSLIT